MSTSPRPRALALLALLTLIWGFNWPVLKIGASELPPLWFRALGLLLGTAFLGSVLLARGVALRIPRAAFARIVLLSLPNVTFWYSAATIAVTHLPAGRSAILGFTMPAWSALIGAAVYRERLDPRTLLGVCAAVAGVVVLVSGDWNTLSAHPLGVLLMLFAAASWAWGTHLLKRVAPSVDPLVLTFWLLAAGMPFVLGLSALFEGARWRVPEGHEWWPILYNALLVRTVGNAIWFSVACRLPATVAGLSTMLIPAVGVFSAMAILHETPGWRDLVALALVSLAVATALWPRRSAAVADRAR